MPTDRNNHHYNNYCNNHDYCKESHCLLFKDKYNRDSMLQSSVHCRKLPLTTTATLTGKHIDKQINSTKGNGCIYRSEQTHSWQQLYQSAGTDAVQCNLQALFLLMPDRLCKLERAVRLTWAGHALSAFDEVILEALVGSHLPCWQALMV